ncbi:uncharacterized protein LOC112093407 [Morus notabilis]|uniref:uncharacterized protein LOC112093407 n=1 Tax=Morus notabilis TaxID=981085 RepID=UPI000CED1369|nr:uncharacterized protein LOC112093407 [Morus notabilis]
MHRYRDELGRFAQRPDLENPSEILSDSSSSSPSHSSSLEFAFQNLFAMALRPAGKVPENQSEILEHLTQLKINLPLLHVIKQVPAYAKVIKDLYTIKRKYHVRKTVFLTEQVSAVIKQKTPLKYRDPGCLGDIKPTSVVLQLADRSIKRPRGIVEDVLLQVDKFYYLVDFVVLDTQSVVDVESKIPIILGRPFLATANALINCRNGLMKISFGNMTLEVNVFNIVKQPQGDDECHQTFLIDTLVEEEVLLQSNSEDLENLLQNSESESSGPCELANISAIFNNSQDRGIKFKQLCFEKLPQGREKPKPSIEETPTVKLAQLPEGLKHAFLGVGDTFPVIISSKLDASQEQRLINML